MNRNKSTITVVPYDSDHYVSSFSNDNWWDFIHGINKMTGPGSGTHFAW
jgi:hypothetical protein